MQYIGLAIAIGRIFGAALTVSIGEIVLVGSIYAGIVGVIVGFAGTIWEDRYNWMCYVRNQKRIKKSSIGQAKTRRAYRSTNHMHLEKLTN